MRNSLITTKCFFTQNNLYLITVFALLIVWAKIGQTQTFSAEIGPYFPIASIPEKIDSQDKYNLNVGFFISIERFGKSFWEVDAPYRKGFRIGYATLSGRPVNEYTNGSQLLKSPDRRFKMFFLSYVIQIKLSKSESSVFMIDVGGTLSFMSANNIGGGSITRSDSFIRLNSVVNLGLQVGIADEIRLNNKINYIIGGFFQLQPGRGPMEYPFSADLMLRAGISGSLF